MRTLQIVYDLAATTSRTEKEQVLFNAFMTGERDFFVAARLAYDPMITFGIAKVGLIAEDDGMPGTLTFAEFLDLAHKLRRRDLTGNAARNAINAAAERSDQPTWNGLYRRILLKDLKAGVEAKTINKVLAKIGKGEREALDYMIPLFGCQLAEDAGKPENFAKIKGKRFLDVKLDGVRVVSILDKQAGVTLFTRNGQPIENFPALTTALQALCDQLPGSVMLDGEVVTTSFQDLMTQLQRDDADDRNAKLALFDMLPLDDFRAGGGTRTQAERHAALVALETHGLLKAAEGRLYIVPKVLVDLSTEDGQESFAEFNRTALEAGYEGVMLKDPEAPYQMKRSSAWAKRKPFVEVTLTVVEVVEGKADGKYVGTTGALLCRGEDDGRSIEVSVGSGFSDAERDEIWTKRDEIVDMLVEIRADAFSLEQGGTVYSLRFPRFKGFRGRQKGEKI